MCHYFYEVLYESEFDQKMLEEGLFASRRVTSVVYCIKSFCTRTKLSHNFESVDSILSKAHEIK